MAAYEIMSRQDPYLTVRVLFDELMFEQLLVSMKTGTALDAMLKSYADNYETNLFALRGVINVSPTAIDTAMEEDENTLAGIK